MAECLRERTYDGDQTGRKGVLELRKILVDWLLDPPPCWNCKRPMTERRRWCFRWENERRRRRCVPYPNYRSTGLPPALFCGFVEIQLACQIDGPYDVVCDRDARALLGATDLRQPSLPEEVRQTRKNLDRLLEDAVAANGRLVLKTQLKYYSPNGSITRADLLQGGMIGCRRALLDYDPLKASFATYSIPWIRQGLGEVFSDRDLVGTPEDVLSRGRKLEGLGIVNAEVLSALRGVADFRGSESSQDFTGAVELLCQSLHLERSAGDVDDLRKVVAGGPKGQTRDRTLERVASWAAARIDAMIRSVEAAKAQAHPKSKPTKSKKPPHTLPKRPHTTGSALLTTLRHGVPLVAPVGETATEEAPDTHTVEARDLFAELEEYEEHSGQAQRFHRALARVRFEDPEAAEVLLRHHGLDGLEAETLDEISARPLRSSGRKLCRESIRQLGERGEGRLAGHLRALAEIEDDDDFDDKDPNDEGWDPDLTLQPKKVVTIVAPPRGELPPVSAEELERQPPSFLVF